MLRQPGTAAAIRRVHHTHGPFERELFENVGVVGALMDFNARAYSPLLGRFLSADSIVPRPGDPQSLNRFAYARNSPLVRVDPTGHIDIGALILGIGDQFFDDVSLGGWSALNVDVKTRFATEDSVDYNAGRVVGQVAALLTGGGEIGGGVSTVLGSLGLSGLCMAATAGGCIPVAAGISAAGVVGGTALVGHGVLVAGKVLSNGDPLTKAFSKGTSAEDVQQRIQRLEKGVGSLEQQVTEHQAKLEGYRQNPDAFDNQGLLRNAPTPAIRTKIIAGRIQKLEREIQKFHGEIQKMRAEIERLRQE